MITKILDFFSNSKPVQQNNAAISELTESDINSLVMYLCFSPDPNKALKKIKNGMCVTDYLKVTNGIRKISELQALVKKTLNL